VAIATVPPFAARFTVTITGVVSTVEHEPIVKTALKAVEAVKFPVANVDAVAFATAAHVVNGATAFCQTILPVDPDHVSDEPGAVAVHTELLPVITPAIAGTVVTVI